MIEIKDLVKAYPDATPINHLNAIINDGEVVSIIGPSGTGKSTLLRCINLLDRPTSGEILVDGVNILAKDVNVCEIRKKIGMVFQSFNLFNHLTVIENIMKPQMDLLKRSKQEAYDIAINKLSAVGLKEKALNYPDELSGGQKQRVSIARTLAMDNDVILFDEPTSALDPTMVGEVQSVISKLKDLHKTMIIVTHEMKFAKEIASKVFYLDHGVVYEEGTPEEIFENPKKEETRIFIMRIKKHEFNITSKDFDFIGKIQEISNFLKDNDVKNNKIIKVEHCFEELICSILIPKLNNIDINVTIEYSEKNDEISMNINYAGEEIKEDDSLPYKIIKANCLNYSTIKKDELVTIHLTF